jgi:hypothetical protein
MSTVPDEADRGPEETKSEFDSDIESVQKSSARDGGDGGAEEPPKISDILEEVRHEAEEDNAVRPNGRVFGGYKQIGQDKAEQDGKDKEMPATPVRERPSSADGSLSTPDDTPSIQVLPTIAGPGGHANRSTRIPYVLPQGAVLH